MIKTDVANLKGVPHLVPVWLRFLSDNNISR